MAAGADGVELDVRLCRSGEAVVFHDDDLRRLVGRDGRVDELDLAQLKRLRLIGGGEIPTLLEALRSVPGALVNVEIKTAPRAELGLLVDATVAAIRAARPQARRVSLSSFDVRALFLVRQRDPAIQRALLFHGSQVLPLRRGWLARAVAATAVHPEQALVTRRRVRRWHGAGYRVRAWTVDDRDRQRQLATWGVDALICNDPAAAIEALGTDART